MPTTWLSRYDLALRCPYYSRLTGPAILLWDVQHPRQVSWYHWDHVERWRRSSRDPRWAMQGASGPTIHAQTASRIYEAYGWIHVGETSGLLTKYFKQYRERNGEEDISWLINNVISDAVSNIKSFMKLTKALCSSPVALPAALVATLTNCPPFYFLPGQDDCNGAERPGDDHGRSSAHPTISVRDWAGARHAGPRYIPLLCVQLCMSFMLIVMFHRSTVNVQRLQARLQALGANVSCEAGPGVSHVAYHWGPEERGRSGMQKHWVPTSGAWAVVQRERKRPTSPTDTVNTAQHFVTRTSTVPKYICSLLQ